MSAAHDTLARAYACVAMKMLLQPNRLLTHPSDTYQIRLAKNLDDIQAAQRLRFMVFNLELGEGLQESLQTGLDADPYDAVCDHLLVEHVPSGDIVGTYRLQTGTVAGSRLGYYSAEEFDFRPYEPLRSELLELGRACVHREHRNLLVLGLLWKGIAQYAARRGARYLCGCSSLTSQDPAEGASIYAELCRRHQAPPPLRTQPLPRYACPLDRLASENEKVPKLLKAYLTIGAKICGPPAIDRRFRTIDFLTLLDLESLPAIVRERFTSTDL